MSKYTFTDFTLELVSECESAPMCIKIGNTGFSIDLPKGGAFYFVPLSESEENVVMFKMDSSTDRPPEISFIVSNIELEQLKKVSLLPVNGLCGEKHG
ncbi:conserved hypothetical protein [Vibrio nigripulchritudo SOn1]|uniref:Uncharacterized protein n=1 Tax=Vibrio nigripulchritudo SOn1 TaxID=1238450 RepID=A0AAV2VL62_9VIBR|nr:hypothetical protein [Vibrio nigripulchritudo]CCO45428.1 conserved hypothetical protein [Vibrio nigripulchritudo SOn1]